MGGRIFLVVDVVLSSCTGKRGGMEYQCLLCIVLSSLLDSLCYDTDIECTFLMRLKNTYPFLELDDL